MLRLMNFVRHFEIMLLLQTTPDPNCGIPYYNRVNLILQHHHCSVTLTRPEMSVDRIVEP